MTWSRLVYPAFESTGIAGLVRLQSLLDAYHRLDKLPPLLAAEVRTQFGRTHAQDTLLERAVLRDRWHVLRHRQSKDQRLRVQHTWLCGLESGRIALILDFAVGTMW